MKNLHVLLAEKSSNLIKDFNGKLLLNYNNVHSLRHGYQFQHIYITSDEDIKGEEYQLYNPLGNFNNAKVSKAERLLKNDGRRKKLS